jgi:hypothetical protein
MSIHGARKIGSLLSPLVLRELGMPSDVVRLPEITEAWAAAVGPDLAGRVYPIRFHAGKLVLRAVSSVWVSKVRHSHETLVRQLRSQPFFRDLVGIEVRAVPLERGRTKRTARKAPVLSDATRKLLTAVSGDIADPTLRAALERLARKR